MPNSKHVLGAKVEKKIFGTARVGEKGQIVIPKEARELFRIESGDTLLILVDKSCGIVITKVDMFNDAASKILANLKGEDKW